MIGRIQGILIEKKPPLLLVDVGGLGYEVFCPMTSIYQTPEPGQTITLHTHLVVREDAHTLFGFHTPLDRRLFRLLIKVNGIGPKLALTILSSMDANAFIQCVSFGDHATLVSIPGIGKKTAERLLIEMRDATKDWDVATPANAMPASGAVQDTLAALLTLGYKENEIRKVLKRLNPESQSSETLIKAALKEM